MADKKELKKAAAAASRTVAKANYKSAKKEYDRERAGWHAIHFGGKVPGRTQYGPGEHDPVVGVLSGRAKFPKGRKERPSPPGSGAK